MREIKFRSWVISKQEMLYKFIMDSPSVSENEGRVLMQYTGLHDKNGKEIYEGDIVKVNWRKDSAIGKVKWINYGFYVVGMDRHSPIPLASNRVNLEVIGNIYENSDLLEVVE